MKKYKIIKNISKFLIKILKVIRPNAGTSLPGAVMMKFCPEYLKYEGEKIHNEIICVTGTNGKTTTSGYIASILNETQKEVVHNKKGANMPQGIATCFLQNDGKSIDYGVFECDEAWLYSLFKSLKANYLLVTNLFPDQTERYGGVYTLAGRIKKAVEINPDLKIILNADDPHLLLLVNKNTVLYGVEEVENNIEDMNSVSEICTCGAQYKYSNLYYSHIGHYNCENCNNKRPEPKYRGKIIINKGCTEVIINEKYNFKTSLVGLHNGYNLLSAASLGLEMGFDETLIQRGIDNYQNAFGRTDKFEINEKQVLIQLIKNPAGANEAIKLIKDRLNSKLFVLLNDTPADGSDISWLYDTDFEYFKDYPNTVILSGTRANALALRFKHAGLKEENLYIESNIRKAYKYAINSITHEEELLILANFTTLAELKKIMKK